jgi:hypothetical protein
MLFAISDAGEAILFVVTLAGWAVVSVYLLALAARAYLVIVQGTADGVDRVEWPDEPIFDWIVTALYFLGLAALILTPAGILGRALAGRLFPEDRALRFVVLVTPLAWLFFPVGLLSSMSGATRWAVLSPRIVVGMFRVAPSAFVFYVVTGVLLACVGGLGYLGLFSPRWYVLPLSVLAMAAIWMVHARLVGRLAWLIRERSRGVVKARRAEQRPRKKRARSRAAEDPWAVPDEEEAPPARSGSMGYAAVEAEEPRPARPNYLDPPPNPYTLSDPLDEPEPAARPTPAVSDERLEREIALRRRERPNPPPASPLWSGVYEFPLYEDCRGPLVYLVLFGGVSGAMFRVLLALLGS